VDLNPHYFFKPSLYYYFLSFVMAPYFLYIKITGIQIESYQDFVGTVTLIARVATALTGVLGVYVMYLIGKNLRDDRTGLIVSGFLAITLGYAYYAQFSRLSFLYWASFIGGLAFSTKYNALFFVGLTLLICYIHHVVSGFERGLFWKTIFKHFLSRPFILVVALFAAGFLVATPFAVLDFKSFFRDVLEQFFTTKDMKGFQGKEIWLSNIVHLKMVMGWPMLLFLFGAFFYGFYKWVKKPDFIAAVLIFIPLTSLIYMSTWRISEIRYVLPVVPFLILSGGIFLSDIFKDIKKKKTFKVSTAIVLGSVILYTMIFTWRGIRWFSNDTREMATQWIEKNMEIESQVEVYGYLSYLPRFPDHVALNKINPNYIPLSFRYESFKKSDLGRKLVGNGKDIINKNSETNQDAFTLESLGERNPDYIVLSSFYYKRYVPDNKTESHVLFPELNRYFQQLMNGEAGYRSIEVFKNMNTGMEEYFLNPEIYILKKI
jgi:hypothetical protein